jgi:hypothetical protein
MHRPDGSGHRQADQDVAEGVQSIPLIEYANLDVNLSQLGANALDFGFLMPSRMTTDFTGVLCCCCCTTGISIHL